MTLPTPHDKNPVTSHVALLGASNVAKALPRALPELVARFAKDAPAKRLAVYAARGCGRSYGIPSGIFGFATSALSSCSLFAALEARRRQAPQGTLHALLTDVGNDILFDVPAAQICTWVHDTSERLRQLGCTVAVTALPVDSVSRMPTWKFRALRPFYYPGRRLPQAHVLEEMQRVQEGLQELARNGELAVLPTRTEWYGFDHFHLRAAAQREAFGGWFDALLGRPPGAEGLADFALEASSWKLRFHRPQEYTWRKRPRQRAQTGIELTPWARLYAY